LVAGNALRNDQRSIGRHPAVGFGIDGADSHLNKGVTGAMKSDGIILGAGVVGWAALVLVLVCMWWKNTHKP
jgi:hypothetical protein